MLNLSPLFFTTVENETSFLSNLELSPQQKNNLREAKSLIRKCLKDELSGRLQEMGIEEHIEPRFYTQGSWKYKTINTPCITPPQQADLDDGCYLPMTFITETSTRPKQATKIFFDAVEQALVTLASSKGWKTDFTKPTCVRLIITEDSHVDIPLYAIPDSEFPKLEKSANDRGYSTLIEAAMDSKFLSWASLPQNEVLLAHRRLDWIVSDPRAISDWFEGECETHGPQLKRVVRYLKAWRDKQWKTGGPSSILLMATLVDFFEYNDKRDDLALLNVVEQMPMQLEKGVKNPMDQNESLTKRLGAEGVKDLIDKLVALKSYLERAIEGSSPAQSIAWMVEMFGDRFPTAPDRVKFVSAEAVVAGVAATISTDRPVISNVTSGSNCR